jgi:hemerythrin-like domain-containing protein
MTLIIDQLRREHAGLAALLDVLDRQASVLAEAGGEPDNEALAALGEYFSDYPELVHHPKEDLIWRALKTRDGAAAAAIGDLEGEHRHLKELTRGFVAAIDAVLHDAEVRREVAAQIIRRFVDAERRHMEKEEKQFFPAAARALKPEDWAGIAARAGQRPDPLADPAADRRFAALRRMIGDGAGPAAR